MIRPARSPLVPLVAALLAACGGGGSGGGSPTPTPANQAPSFTSGATASAPENATGSVYTAAASDPDGNALTFAISGGADRERFRITPAGALSFASAPDFEAPADADRDNVYRVELSVSDGQASATLALSVTVTNAGSDALVVRRVGSGFSEPLYLTGFPENSGRVLVVEKGGRVRLLSPASGQAADPPFLDIRGTISTDGERGLLGLALAGDFEASGVFYIYVTNPAGDIELRRYRTLGDRTRADPASGDVLLRIAHPRSNHNGGWIDFGPDGFLYLATGDGGGGGDPDGNGQNRNTLLGKILRIDVSRDAFPDDPNRDYTIPPGNPFAGGGGAPEVWALGLRNPFRASFDAATGNLIIGDVGQGAAEEISLMRPGDGGANFGWSILEGTRALQGGATAGLTPPVAEYEHGSGPRNGRSVTGGHVYRGSVERLRGQYVFGDFVTGNLWSLPAASLAVGTTIPAAQFTLRTEEFRPAAGAIGNVASFGVDRAGELYIVDFDGEIFRIEAQ
jgi:glucose/arabinose dehydrogenase